MDTLGTQIDPKDFAALMKVIKDFDPAFAKAVREQMRTAGKALQDAIRARVMERPPSGGRSPGNHSSRKQIAAGIKYRIDSSGDGPALTIEVSANKMDAGREPFVKAYNKQSFRHPVFGNRRVFVKQLGNPFFTDTKEPQRIGDKIMRDAVEQLTAEMDH